MLGDGLGLALEINLQDSDPMCVNTRIQALTATINELVMHTIMNRQARYGQFMSDDIITYRFLMEQ